MTMNANIRLRDFLNGKQDEVFERLQNGENLSAMYPQEQAAWDAYNAKGRNLNESAGISQKRIYD